MMAIEWKPTINIQKRISNLSGFKKEENIKITQDLATKKKIIKTEKFMN
jgi:hypothetical protein